MHDGHAKGPKVAGCVITGDDTGRVLASLAVYLASLAVYLACMARGVCIAILAAAIPDMALASGVAPTLFGE
ncbi:hypothetical protein B484DRAFT_402877, partial [Ochromonadaceae sp. CCMP2298]